MPGTWIDWAVVAVIVCVGLGILYKALKEPLDILFGGIKRGIVGIINKISGVKDEGMYEVIKYG